MTEVDVEHWYHDAKFNDKPDAKVNSRGLFSSIGMFFIGFFVAAILGFCMYWFSDDGTNVIEDSALWGGYSEINVRQIYDVNTGVMYAVTDTGDICVMVDANGKPIVEDNNEETIA